MSKYEVRNDADSVVAGGDDRKAVLDEAAGMAPGTYTLYKNMGAFTIEERTETVVRRTRFESTTKRPRAAKAATEAPAAQPAQRGAESGAGGGLLSRLRG